MVPRLRLHTPREGGLDSIFGQGTRSHVLQLKILHAATKFCGQMNKINYNCKNLKNRNGETKFRGKSLAHKVTECPELEPRQPSPESEPSSTLWPPLLFSPLLLSQHPVSRPFWRYPLSPWSCCGPAQVARSGASQGWTSYWDMGKPWHWNKKVIFLPKVQAIGLSVL